MASPRLVGATLYTAFLGKTSTAQMTTRTVGTHTHIGNNPHGTVQDRGPVCADVILPTSQRMLRTKTTVKRTQKRRTAH